MIRSFRDREDGALQLAAMMKRRVLWDPLILAIPRGGLLTGAVLARELGGELDALLVRKLRAPNQPELAIGSVSELGRVSLNAYAKAIEEVTDAYLQQEIQEQLAILIERRRLFRQVRTAASPTGRSCIITDDGIATGSTIIAACRAIRAEQPAEIVIAVPVLPASRVAALRNEADDLVAVIAPEEFHAVSEFYDDFEPVDDARAVELMRVLRPVEARVTSPWA